MPYIATKPGTAFRTFTDKDIFSGDGSTTVFDMQFAIAEAGQNDLQIFVAGALKIPGTDFTLGVDGTGEYKRITFTSAPANGSNNIVILNPGTVEGELATVADNAITSGKVNVDVITGQTELSEAAANNDTLLIHDTSASALKKIQVSNLTAQAGDGLSKTNSTLAVDIPNTTLLSAAAATNDEILIYDTSASALRSITQSNFLAAPVVSSVSPTNVVSGDGTGNHTIVITGTGFTAGSADLIGADGSVVTFSSQTVDSATQITGVVAKSSIVQSGEPYDVRVTGTNGLKATLDNQINVDSAPIYSTAAGSLGIVADSGRAAGQSFTVVAADPESGGDVVYTVESGSIPSGMSFSSTSSGGVISGTPNAVGSNTTSTFTIRAKDAASNTTDRQFTIQVLAPAYQSYTSSSTFTVPTGTTAVDVLVVAGGGSGGSDNGGGGGAGGLIYRPGFTVTPGATLTVTVGNGATTPGADNYSPVSGQDSVFGTLTAKGGGGGGVGDGADGGSGGGGGGHGASGGATSQANQSGDSGNYGFGAVGGQGNAGGGRAGGGGGGAGGQGTDGNGGSSAGGPGGSGRSYSISDGTTSVTYAGGGGGGSNGGSGGSGGPTGGDGATGTGQAATPNRGAGGGGGGNSSPRPGGAGGKGIVIVKY